MYFYLEEKRHTEDIKFNLLTCAYSNTDTKQNKLLGSSVRCQVLSVICQLLPVTNDNSYSHRQDPCQLPLPKPRRLVFVSGFFFFKNFVEKLLLTANKNASFSEPGKSVKSTFVKIKFSKLNPCLLTSTSYL